MKVTIQNIEPELMFDIKGIRLYRYKYPHFGYFAWGGLVKTSTRRNDLYRYSRRGCSDYIYRICINKEGMDNLHDNTDEYNIEKVTGQKVRDLKHLWRDDDITFTDWDNVAYSLAYYKESDYHDDTGLTNLELQRQRTANKDKLLEGLFGNSLRALGEKYSYNFKYFNHGLAQVEWQYERNFFVKEIEKLVNDTIIKDLNALGFDVEFDINTFIYAFGHGVIHSIKARDDLFEKEKADESNIERGEN